ncbi:shikimate dehydrogenase [Sphaerotilus sp.]|uniref:shikimate dehydrogenase n=1 Tax=Sphaerotilus sp. TaxID=2093942 RepID=UPI002ACEFD3D|nr:shikimate dehydrogenase [Sphaerotilus sp.]MDZ7857183.1 shikimate dehydrogenase [Sphaerotilus sp.]
MDRYAVIGHPVEHSRSPDIQARFAAQTGQSIDYTRRLSPLDGFTATVRQFAADGAHGCNVTVPFKFEAWQLAPRRTPRAQRAEAANTLRFDAGGWWCDNTDGIGLVRDITVNAGVALAGRRVLLIGAGGAAAGVLGPLIEAGPSALVVANRTADKAQALVDRHADLARDHGVALSAAPLDAPGTAFDLVLNGTASSLAGAGVPVPASVLRVGGLAVDMMYGAGARPFLDWAAQHGATGRDGLGMLVEQAAESFFAWRGVRPDTAPVLAALRAQIDAPR